MSKTLFDAIWAEHVVRTYSDGSDLLFIDRHLLHEVTSPQAFSGLEIARRSVRYPELTISTEDHLVATTPGRTGASFDQGQKLVMRARSNAQTFGIRHFDVADPDQGIVHVIAGELGIVLPGMTAVCGDSHTCTLGALGAVAFGIGTSDVEHVLATQTLRQKKPSNMLVRLDGALPRQVYAKDVILRLCGQIGAAGGVGHAIEFAGSFVRDLGMDGRFTLCNMSIEVGARIGLVATDAKTLRYLAANARHRGAAAGSEDGTPWCPTADVHLGGADANYSRIVSLDVSELSPQITWGTNPDQVIDIDGRVDDDQSDRTRSALDYMQLRRGARLLGKKIDQVFIGSCTNGRIDDLRAAAIVVEGARVAPHVRARVVPGSKAVKRAAEAEGLHEIFIDAGFSWGEPGCSMCASINQEFVAPQHRCVSTSNRNFIGRQGPGARTHLASPAVAAACALAGEVADPRFISR
ncbi:3-isopropylmalate dehydratase large subunit [Burkholderia vietnamiensis]|uniref:3-isopropylmalate dehydratase large subunit n=1 Tax=Burkholderia vietnamiensis TaxID=60552 RepID=UPI001593BFC2|nr:3-isopropylmalate dehydratase large subunit [Burkholderia vietnamiensis]